MKRDEHFITKLTAAEILERRAPFAQPFQGEKVNAVKNSGEILVLTIYAYNIGEGLFSGIDENGNQDRYNLSDFESFELLQQ
jgi:hypothetical protein